MSAILDFISNNALFSTLTASAILAVVGWIWKLQCDRKDGDTIYSFLVASKSETAFTFRSTQAIASHTKLTEERVAVVCARHPKIRRNQKERQSWMLVE